MSYTKPPLIASLDINIAAGNTTGTIIAAPGVGLRIRLVGGQVHINRASTAGVNLYLRNGAAGTIIWHHSGAIMAGSSGGPILVPEPGIVLSDNTLLQGETNNGSAASSNAKFLVYYYVEQV